MIQPQLAVSILDIPTKPRRARLAIFAAVATVLTICTAHAQTFTVLHTFNGAPDGRAPVAGLTRDAAGNLYGTTYHGGAHDLGFIYRLAHKNSGWVLTPLYSFQGGNDGSAPIAGLTIAPDGNLYGATSRGGQHGAGTVYKVSAPAAFTCRSLYCPWTVTPLYQFTGGADGGTPDAAPILDSAGNLYGTAGTGGTGQSGIVYKLTHSASGWTESVLYNFAGSPDGNGPFSAVTFDNNGNLYGTTLEGGVSGLGTVYQLTPSGSGWTEKVLYSFQGSNDGALPYAGVVVDPAGNLYGATYFFGAGNGGTIFELMPSNGNWIFSVIYSPQLMGEGGAAGTLARSPNGTLYGTLFTSANGSCGGEGCGSVFQLAPSGGGWMYTSLYQFTGGADGANPEGCLILDQAGNVYGTTTGNFSGDGSVFEVTP